MMRLFIKTTVVLMLVFSVFGSPCPGPNNSEKQFKVVQKKLNWYGSQLHCNSNNMTLATIVSQQEQDKVEQLIAQTGSGRYWLGGTDLHNEGQFVWFSTGESITYSNYRPGEPNNRKSPGVVEDCLELIVGNLWGDYNWNYEWNDGICKDSHFFICEFFE